MALTIPWMQGQPLPETSLCEIVSTVTRCWCCDQSPNPIDIEEHSSCSDDNLFIGAAWQNYGTSSSYLYDMRSANHLYFDWSATNPDVTKSDPKLMTHVDKWWSNDNIHWYWHTNAGFTNVSDPQLPLSHCLLLNQVYKYLLTCWWVKWDYTNDLSLRFKKIIVTNMLASNGHIQW